MEQAQADIPVIYQDHHLLIVNKPAGLVVHPTYKHADGTMWDALLAYLARQGEDDWAPPDLPDEPDWLRAPEHIRLMLRERRRERFYAEDGLLPRPTLLHRLDKDTSGVVALARTAGACRHVIHQFSAHTIQKTYLAVAHRGSPAWAQPRATYTATLYRENEEGESLPWPLDLSLTKNLPILLDGPLQRDPDDRRRCIVGPDGQQASTQITVLAGQDNFFLIKAQPVTGRTHQIRAHLTAAGYALVGDPTYLPAYQPGHPAALLDRQFLHAVSLSFRDYPTNIPRTFYAPLPQELLLWLEKHFPTGFLLADAPGIVIA